MGVITLLKNTPKVIVKTTGKLATKFHTNKPQIYFWGGVFATVVGFGYAVYNATKLKDTMAVGEAEVDELEVTRSGVQEKDIPEEDKTELIATYDKLIKKAKIHSILRILRLMGIPFMVFAGGILLMIGGHRILFIRFGQLSTAYATLMETFRKYRQMNIAEHGEECDRRYRYGIVDEITTGAEVTDEKGKKKQVKCKIPVVDRNAAASMYQFCFSEDFSPKCPKDPVSMISFLRCQEKYWNTWMEGHQKPVTLYMVLNDLGIDIDTDDPENDYIMMAGWRPNGDGDNHIDFGIMRAVNKPALDMLENVCFLNFNCDGNLWHSPRYKKDGTKVCA